MASGAVIFLKDSPQIFHLPTGALALFLMAISTRQLQAQFNHIAGDQNRATLRSVINFDRFTHLVLQTSKVFGLF